MSMVVQHNMTAMNANRMLGVTVGQQAKSTEKLSSGFKINRAADDAAGLSISEKMRKQMRGLDRASTNAQDGISAVQTAEGALTEVHSMLQRMNELATQAANGTNSDTDRKAIQDEIDQLTTEIDRVAETTKFNEAYLLKGDASGASSKINVNAHDAGIKGKLIDNGDGTSTFKLDAPLKAGSEITVAGELIKIGNTKTVNDYDTLANVQDTTMQIGDTITRANGESKTITSNATDNAIAIFLVSKRGDAAGTALGKLTLADGTEYEFATSVTSDKILVNGIDTASTINSADALDDIISGVDLQGAKFTDASGQEWDVVSSLNRDEMTVFDTTSGALMGTMTATAIATANGITLAAGDTVTTITTDADNNKVETSKTAYNGILATGNSSKALSIEDLANKLNKLSVGAEVRVGAYNAANLTTTNNYIAYTIAGSKDAEAGNTLTVDSILAKLKEGDLVAFDEDKSGGILTAAETFSIAGVDSEEGTVSVKDAYKKIADELSKASSIGTDKGSEAVATSNGDGSFTIKQGTVEVKDSLSFSLHVGADADMTNKISIDMESMDAAALGIKGININDETGTAATYAIDAISDAISKVSAQRSTLGAAQNRLEHTIANLDNVVENTTSAESQIRDTDMATEMVNYSKNNILAQAGQSMLAQANQSNQGILSLLG